jgi:hypothetical protein
VRCEFEAIARRGAQDLIAILEGVGNGLPPGHSLDKEIVMIQEIGSVLGPRATARIATSALPCVPVLPEPRQRYAVTRRLLGVLTGRSRSRA